MWGLNVITRRIFYSPCLLRNLQRCYGEKLGNKYSELEKQNILEVINKSDVTTLSRYDVTKKRSKSIKQWISQNGPISNLIDVEVIEGFSEKHAEKLFDSIRSGKVKTEEPNALKKIKGQILNPTLAESVRQQIKSVLTIYVTVNSVSWTLINRSNYEVHDWQFKSINYPDSKRFQLSDITDISWNIVNKLPSADIYVMKAEATSLRASGSDPNNPKALAVNLQKAQMVSMLVALLSARENSVQRIDSDTNEDDTEKDKFKHNVFFMRASLPFRLYGTLIGNERVTSDQTVEILLQEISSKPSDNSHVFVPEKFKENFRFQKDLQRDMMGQCLLFALTFMDLCIYKNQEKINQLLSKKDE